jgi:hypothetical protein
MSATSAVAINNLAGYSFTMNTKTNNSWTLLPPVGAEPIKTMNITNGRTCDLHFSRAIGGYSVGLDKKDILVSLGAVEIGATPTRVPAVPHVAGVYLPIGGEFTALSTIYPAPTPAPAPACLSAGAGSYGELEGWSFSLNTDTNNSYTLRPPAGCDVPKHLSFSWYSRPLHYSKYVDGYSVGLRAKADLESRGAFYVDA